MYWDMPDIRVRASEISAVRSVKLGSDLIRIAAVLPPRLVNEANSRTHSESVESEENGVVSSASRSLATAMGLIFNG